MSLLLKEIELFDSATPLLDPVYMDEVGIAKGSSTLSFDRLLALKTALEAVEPVPPNATTLLLNDAVKVSDGVGAIVMTGATAGCSISSSGADLAVKSLASDMSFEATAGGVISFLSIPQCAIAPTVGDDLVNKTYVDTQAGIVPPLADVLLAGNSAGATGIDMNTQDILNIKDVRFSGDLASSDGSKEIRLQHDYMHLFDNTNDGRYVRIEGEFLKLYTPSATGQLYIRNSYGASEYNIEATDKDLNMSTTERLYLYGLGSGISLTAGQGGNITTNVLPQCSVVPSLSDQLVNKAYVDSKIAGEVSFLRYKLVGGSFSALTPDTWTTVVNSPLTALQGSLSTGVTYTFKVDLTFVGLTKEATSSCRFKFKNGAGAYFEPDVIGNATTPCASSAIVSSYGSPATSTFSVSSTLDFTTATDSSITIELSLAASSAWASSYNVVVLLEELKAV